MLLVGCVALIGIYLLVLASGYRAPPGPNREAIRRAAEDTPPPSRSGSSRCGSSRAGSRAPRHLVPSAELEPATEHRSAAGSSAAPVPVEPAPAEPAQVTAPPVEPAPVTAARSARPVLVVPRDRKWIVQRAGARRASSVHPTRDAAEEQGRTTARRERAVFEVRDATGLTVLRDDYGARRQARSALIEAD